MHEIIFLNQYSQEDVQLGKIDKENDFHLLIAATIFTAIFTVLLIAFSSVDFII